MLSALLALALTASAFAQTPRDLKVERIAPPLPEKRTRWALVIGISSYRYAPPRAQLKFANRDAEEFARLLRSPEGGGFPSSNVRLLTEDAATVGAIRAALHEWLSRSAQPNDIVYFFFAGHAVAAERGESYFVANDSDPQNLHATGLPFDEVNRALTKQLRAGTVVLFADACHAGGIGWTSDPSAAPDAAQRSLEALGAADRSFLKLLSARASERSFESEQWGGGHGVFSHGLLTGLRGAAERDGDGFVRVSELIEYISRFVPEQTGAKQNPRIAGNFDAAMAMASLPVSLTRKTEPATLRLLGPPNSAVYLGGQFRGTIRSNGELIVEAVSGPQEMSVDIPGTGSFDQALTLQPGQNSLDLSTSSEFAIARMRAQIRAGNVLGPGGALEQFRSKLFPSAQAASATAEILAALEDTAMQCVSDYVQSTAVGLKRPMFLRSAEAFEALSTFRPGDPALQRNALFCRARAHIAGSQFTEALNALDRSIVIDPQFACSHNARGVALGRLGRLADARAAFRTAAKLAPVWALPPLQIAQQFINAGDLASALPYLESASRLNPKATGIQWSLARVHRLLGNSQDFLRAADAALAADREYAPIYVELAQFYESTRDFAKAALAYDTYLVLAPNFTDSAAVRKRLETLRPPPAAPQTPRVPPTLRRETDKRR
jgi:uncharacterized caspase-like protein/Flp pilus assembly protein TadD